MCRKNEREGNMQKVLVVVDMQNDFIDGALGTKEAVAIVPGVKEKIENFDGVVLFTRDTHETYYLDTQEGQKLPVPHCIRDTEGWQIRSELDALRKTEPIDKETFGSTDLAGELVAMNEDNEIESITFRRFMHRHLCYFQCTSGKSISPGSSDHRRR